MVNRGIFYGYDFGSAQPCIRVSVTLPARPLHDLAHADAWLAGWFQADVKRLAPIDTAAPLDPEALARAAIDRALLLYGELIRAASYPCFDHGRLIALEPSAENPESLVAAVALPVVDNTPKVFLPIFLEALRALEACSRTAPPESAAGNPILARLKAAVAKVTELSPLQAASTIPVGRIAHDHGIPFRHLGSGYMRLGTGCAGQLLHKSAVQTDSAIGSAMCFDKRVTAQVLLAAGLPGAEHIAVTSRDAALAAARKLGWPVVIKPADRERGLGVTAGITNEAALLAAYDGARRVSANVLVERHVAGVCHRVLVANDKVLYAVKRVPKRLFGNGRDDIAALVATKNLKWAKVAPWKPTKPTVLDDLALECLAADGFTPATVLAEGQVAYVRPLSTPEWGGEVEDFTRSIHPDNIELAIAAARLFGLTVAGIDLMTTDITQPWHATGSIINEMNFRPQFTLDDREIDPAIMANVLAGGSGRIPAHLITGSGDLEAAARKLRQQVSKSGRTCHSTSATATEGPDGRAIAMAASTLLERGVALAMRPDVQELILIGTPDEVLSRGLAVDRLESIHVVEADPVEADRLLDQLQARFPARTAATAPRKRAKAKPG